MAQACDGYSKPTLMGNWYEERLAPEQPMRVNPDFKYKREEENAISFPSGTGKLMPLHRVSRNLPWVTQGVVADDGFREFKSLTKTTYDKTNLDNFTRLGDQRSLIKT